MKRLQVLAPSPGIQGPLFLLVVPASAKQTLSLKAHRDPGRSGGFIKKEKTIDCSEQDLNSISNVLDRIRTIHEEQCPGNQSSSKSRGLQSETAIQVFGAYDRRLLNPVDVDGIMTVPRTAFLDSKGQVSPPQQTDALTKKGRDMDSSMNVHDLSDAAPSSSVIESLLATCDSVISHFDDGRKDAAVQSPGHSHSVPGIWDAGNNPEKAGKACDWCATWHRFREGVAAVRSEQSGQLDRFKKYVASQYPQPALVDLREYPVSAQFQTEPRRFINPSIERDWVMWQAATGAFV